MNTECKAYANIIKYSQFLLENKSCAFNQDLCTIVSHEAKKKQAIHNE